MTDSTTHSTAVDTTPAPTIWPCLSYTDADAALRTLVDAFGFEERLVVRGGDGRPVEHAELVWPDGGGVMLGSYDPGGGEFAARPPGVASLYCICRDPDALLARVQRAGLAIVRPMEDTDYGSRGFTARDPEGNLWSFGTYRGSPRG